MRGEGLAGWTVLKGGADVERQVSRLRLGACLHDMVVACFLAAAALQE